MSLVRVRQHVNPLSNRFKQPIAIPDWSQIFGDLNRPLAIDIGCARGRFVQQYAQLEPDWNFLGLEIRAPLVDAANEWREESGLNNVHFLFCNANVSLADLLQTYPASKLQRASIQFPDPWFKKRHQKRRVVQPALVETLAKYLPVGGEMFLQSDVCEVQEEMCEDRKSTRLNSSHQIISYAVFCLKKKKIKTKIMMTWRGQNTEIQTVAKVDQNDDH